jgi:4-aminobutyrate aminotransferase/(S)-3-amino-2-methylpropionate transaminase
MSVTDRTALGGPTLPQERRLVTSIPGPRSVELADRRKAAVASGVSSSMPRPVAACWSTSTATR